MNNPNARGTDGWSFPTFLYLAESLRDSDKALRAADRAFHEERDRRYKEVNIEKEKALKIKEEADREALSLAREIQKYKDEKANELREQINRERGLYVTKTELQSAVEKIETMVRPLNDFVTGQQGRGLGVSATTKFIVTGIGVVVSVLVILTFLAPLLRVAKP